MLAVLTWIVRVFVLGRIPCWHKWSSWFVLESYTKPQGEGRDKSWTPGVVVARVCRGCAIKQVKVHETECGFLDNDYAIQTSNRMVEEIREALRGSP